MNIQTLIIIFNATFLLTNLFYLELIERIFDMKSSRLKKFLFGILASIVGSIMLVLFGSMSALGYFIMLVVYLITVFCFYRDQSIITRLASVLSFNLHIMAVRAIISSVLSLLTGKSIFEQSKNSESFWTVLIATSAFCVIITAVMIYLMPKKYLRVIAQKTEHLISYVALLSIANVYLIANGNVYIHNITYEFLQLHQIIAAITWLCISYVGIFMLVGFDILREHREQLEKDNLFKQVMQKRYMILIEMNCTKDKYKRIIRDGVDEQLPDEPYSTYYKKVLKRIVFHEDYNQAVLNESCEKISEDFLSGTDMVTNVLRFLMDDGKVKWVRCNITSKKDEETGDIIAVIAYIDDIHEAKEKELKLKHKAQIDSLVGAYNKKATESHIKQHLYKNKCGVLFMIDLDNFKSINDNFGHIYGDEVLKDVFSKIVKQFRGDDILGRVGGDEFVAFSLNSLSVEQAERKAAELCKQIKHEYTLDNMSVEISSSIGIALAPQHGLEFEELYDKADKAMYECKNNTKNGFVIYGSNSLNTDT